MAETLTERRLEPPIAPMLGRVVRELPTGDYLYEPKWDGFRCLAFRRNDDLVLQSRNGRSLSPYFPEIVEALSGLAPREFVIDGELVVIRDGRVDFAALLGRIHPAAAYVKRMRREAPAAYGCLDALAARLDTHWVARDRVRRSDWRHFKVVFRARRCARADWPPGRLVRPGSRSAFPPPQRRLPIGLIRP